MELFVFFSLKTSGQSTTPTVLQLMSHGILHQAITSFPSSGHQVITHLHSLTFIPSHDRSTGHHPHYFFIPYKSCQGHTQNPFQNFHASRLQQPGGLDSGPTYQEPMISPTNKVVQPCTDGCPDQIHYPIVHWVPQLSIAQN